jgi:Phage T7 tail fibre protein/Domain of unknown function (DUF1983)
MTTRVLYPGNGVTNNFTIPCPYLDPTNVKVTVNLIGLVYGIQYTVAGGTVTLTSAPLLHDAVEVFRSTPIASAAATFHNGAVLGEAELNLANLQLLYALQELEDNYDAKLNNSAVAIASATGVVIVDPRAIIDNLVQSVLNSALLATLQANISAITANTSGVAANSAAITAEQTARVNADSALATAISSISAGTGSKTFSQGTAPTTGMAAGDLWFNTASNNQAYRYNGSAWVATDDTRIASTAALLTTETTARTSGDTANATSITTLAARVTAAESNITGNTAAISTETSARASGDSASASSITTLSTTVGANTSAISTQATSISGIQSKYTVKVDTNGYVSGYGLISTANTAGASSQFIVLADQFAVVTPGLAAKAPFVVGNVNGVSTVGISGQLIVDGTIAGNAIIANTITAGKIDTRGLDIKDAGGTVILSAGTPLTASYITPSSGWLNSNVTAAGIGAVQTSLGNAPAGILNGNITVSGGVIGGIGAGNGTAVANSSISIGSNGVLSGAGGGTVSLSGLGAGAFAFLSSITSANISTYIASAAIGTAYIADAAITSAKIGTAVITSAKIGDLEVGTLKLANGAVSTTVGVENHAGPYSASMTGVEATVVISSADIPAGQATVPVLITGSCHISATTNFDIGYASGTTFSGTAGTTPFWNGYFYETYTYGGYLNAGNLISGVSGSTPASYSVIRNFPPGTYTFAKYNRGVTDGGNNGGAYGNLYSQSISITVLKK